MFILSRDPVFQDNLESDKVIGMAEFGINSYVMLWPTNMFFRHGHGGKPHFASPFGGELTGAKGRAS